MPLFSLSANSMVAPTSQDPSALSFLENHPKQLFSLLIFILPLHQLCKVDQEAVSAHILLVDAIERL